MEVVKDIIIPLLSSFIGGMLTLVGVIITIKYEKNKDNKIDKVKAKPVFYVLDRGMRIKSESEAVFRFSNTDYEKSGYVTLIDGIIKNTDKSIFTIEYILINNLKYFPLYGNIVDKNIKVRVMVRGKNVGKEKDIVFVIKDMLNNEYKYKAILKQEYVLKSIEEIK